MAHFAEIDENNTVLRVIVIDENDIQNLPFPESEPVGIAYIASFLPGTWKQSPENNNFRVRPAVIGGKFHPEYGEYGGFSNPKEFDYFVWNEATLDWIPPIPYPTDGADYFWNWRVEKWTPFPVYPPETVTIG
jgi:hypothetical protein